MYEHKKDWNNCLAAYVRGHKQTREFSLMVFHFLSGVLSKNEDCMDADDREALAQAVISHLQELIELDSFMTAKLVVEYFPFHIEAVLHSLDANEDLQVPSLHLFNVDVDDVVD